MAGSTSKWILIVWFLVIVGILVLLISSAVQSQQQQTLLKNLQCCSPSLGAPVRLPLLLQNDPQDVDSWVAYARLDFVMSSSPVGQRQGQGPGGTPANIVSLYAQIDTGSNVLALVSDRCTQCDPSFGTYPWSSQFPRPSTWSTLFQRTLSYGTNTYRVAPTDIVLRLSDSSAPPALLDIKAALIDSAEQCDASNPGDTKCNTSVCGLLPRYGSPLSLSQSASFLDQILGKLQKQLPRAFVLDFRVTTPSLVIGAVDTDPSAEVVPLVKDTMLGSEYFVTRATRVVFYSASGGPAVDIVDIPQQCILDTGSDVFVGSRLFVSHMRGVVMGGGDSGTIRVYFGGRNYLEAHVSSSRTGVVYLDMFDSPPYSDAFIVGLGAMLRNVMTFDLEQNHVTIRAPV